MHNNVCLAYGGFSKERSTLTVIPKPFWDMSTMKN